MLKILIAAWPVLLPVMIYLLWLASNAKKRDIKVRDEYLVKKRRYMFYAIYSTGAIVVIMLVYLFISVDAMPEKVLTPMW